MKRLLALLGALTFILGLSFPAYAASTNISILTEYSTINSPSPPPNFHYSYSSSYVSTPLQPSFSVAIDSGTVIYGDGSAWSADTKTTGWNGASMQNGTSGEWLMGGTPSTGTCGPFAPLTIPDFGPNEDLLTCENAPAFMRGPILGSGALSFSGGSYAEDASPTDLAPSGQLTIATWVELTASSSNEGILYKGTFSSAQGDYELYICASDQICFAVSGSVEVYDPSAFTLNRWEWVVVTYNLSEFVMYVNGTSVLTNAYSSPIATSSSPFVLGAYYSASYTCACNMAGTMVLGGTAWTASEVLESWNAPPILSTLEYFPPSGTTLAYNYYYQVAQTVGAGTTYYNLGKQYTASVTGIYWIDYSTPATAPATNTDISGLILAPLILGAVFIFMRRRR